MTTHEDTQSISFFDPQTNACPYHAYEQLREDAPVWKDPSTGMYFISRYEDLREASLAPKRFTNRIGTGAGSTEKGVRPDDPELTDQMREQMLLEQELAAKYENNGWPTVPTLAGLDAPEHMRRRKLFDHAFRPARVKDLDPFVEALADRLIDAFVDRGEAEIVAEYAVPLPLYVIGHQMGAPEGDMPQIKQWTDAWVQRMGLMQTPDERRWSADQEIEAQHYFQKRFDELRANPNDSLLSELVNVEVPGLGRPLTDNELHSEMMADLFVGGSETTTNAISAGVLYAAQQPEVWARVEADPDRYLEPWCEEIMRLECPVQGLLRETSEEIELHGVTIPAGSVICLRYGAANRDPRRFGDSADAIDLDRKQPRSHLVFGTGIHHCLGAPLARREMYFAFRALVERVRDIRLVGAEADLEYAPNYFLRGVKALPVTFERR